MYAAVSHNVKSHIVRLNYENSNDIWQKDSGCLSFVIDMMTCGDLLRLSM